jgi:FkbH-like protein
VKIAIVGNSTLDPLGRLLRDHTVAMLGMGEFPTCLFDPGSAISREAPDALIVHVDGTALLGAGSGRGAAESVLDGIRAYAESVPGTLVVVNTLLQTPLSGATIADTGVPKSRLAAARHWDLDVHELASSYPNVAVVDLCRMLHHHSASELVADAFWYLGRIRYSSAGFEALASLYRQVLLGHGGAVRKVLVLDLDNTLWGGVIGEEGVGGIELGEDGIGKCFRDFQWLLKDLQSSGVLLAVASKNDTDLAIETIDRHPLMVLRSSDFVSIMANWDDKASNVRALAADLGVSLDSMVFLDDNPRERALVARELPEVAVPDFPERPESIPRWFAEQVSPVYFPRLKVLDEDLRKTEQYRARAHRQKLQTTDLEGFLESLHIKLTFAVDDYSQTARLAQLTQKTNQFNLTTERATAAEVTDWIESPDHCVISCRYEDRLGDEGTIGLAVIDRREGVLRNLLLSCRVIGRGVEDELLAFCLDLLREEGHRTAEARFVASGRNEPASGFLESHGFVLSAGSDAGEWIGKRELD